MKRLLITVSLLLSLGLSTVGAAAQTDGVEAPDLEALEAQAYDVEGLQTVYDRTFSMDIEAMMASPDFDFESMDVSAMMKMISVQGITFDNEDNAKAYIEDMKSQMEQAQEEDEAGTFDDMEISDLEGFDVDGIRVNMDMPDLEIASSIIIFSDGNFVFQVMTMDSDMDTAKSNVEAVAQFVIDAEIETEEVTFSDDGTSTGGVFDRMPTAEDEVIGDLTGVTDMELHVADE